MIDRTGDKYGRLLVLGRVDNDRYGRTKWKARCDCSNVTVVAAGNLRTGNTRSCGCLEEENRAAGPATHGMYGTPECVAWNNAKQRIFNPKAHAYKRYGGRGLTMAPEWVGPGGFEKFFAHIGPRPEGHTLDRIDNDKGYVPGNVRWADWKTQANNRHAAGETS